MTGRGSRKTGRSYRPAVEALEALRLLSTMETLPSLAVERLPLTEPHAAPLASDAPSLRDSELAWDEVLERARLADFLDTPGSTVEAEDVEAGLRQLNRYLGRAWSRAGVAAQAHDDCSQAVFVSLLQTYGRQRFDQLLADVGRSGIRNLLSRETAEGPDFFRAIDTVKKRAQREKTYQPIDAIDVADRTNSEDARALWRGALREAIDQSLTPREASLVYETLQGKTPAEIAQEWGVAPKTVSNEKSRVIQKLRGVLVAAVDD